MICSIRKRLLVLTLTTLAVVWGMISIWVYISSKHEVEEVYDANLVQTAKLLLTLVQHEMSQDQEEYIHINGLLPPGHKYEANITFVIHHPNGELAMRAPNAPAFPWRAHTPGFHDVTIFGDQWRVFNLVDPTTGVLVQTGQLYHVRDEMVTYLTSSILPAMLLSFPLISFFVWGCIGRGLAPLKAVTRAIADRQVGQLDPVTANLVPIEVRPMVVALNKLLLRLEQAFDSERRFTADAAHELRTPLAGIKTQAQVAQRTSDSEQLQQALGQIIIGTNRSSHLISQLLTLARVESDPAEDWQCVDLRKLVSEVMVEQGDAAGQRSIELIQEGDSVVIECQPDLIRILIANLMNNAILYSDPHGIVKVATTTDGTHASVTVADNGPGVQVEQQNEMFRRFKRGNHEGVYGSGLGLSIVKKVADLHMAEIEMGEGIDHKGLGVRVRFTLNRRAENEMR